MHWVYDDGGRLAAGYKGIARDCVTRAIAIATRRRYQTVYDELANYPRRSKLKKSPRDGVYTKTKWFKDYMQSLGFVWTPTMGIGTGCKVHLRHGELPDGRLVVEVSRHSVAVINGTIYDNHDPSRGGTRCVYGYWTYVPRPAHT
jgi:hypothetical protein